MYWPKQKFHYDLYIDGEPFSWRAIHEFHFEKGLFGFKFRYELNEEYRVCSYGPGKRRGRPSVPIFDEPLLRYPDGIPLPAIPADLEDLLKYIPPIHHSFYKNLSKGFGSEDEDYEEQY